MKENIKKDQWESGLFAIEFLEYDYTERYFREILAKVCDVLNCSWDPENILNAMGDVSIEIEFNEKKDKLLMIMDNWSFSAGFSSEGHRDKVFISLEK